VSTTAPVAEGATPSALTPAERLKATLLFSWFFTSITTLWLLKPIRTATLLVHLGAEELPYLRFGSVAGVALVVLVYSWVVNRYTRLDIVRGSALIFALVLALFWISLRIGGEALGAQRWFVWAVFIMVDIYSTVMVAIFWTYANDVVSRAEADKLYGPIGIGGILGGITGGGAVDVLVRSIGPVDMLLLCVALVVLGGALGWLTEALLKPPPRVVAVKQKAAVEDALEGAREVLRSRYLLWLVAIVVAYEFAAAVTDFVINVVFERAFHTQVEIARMYGRLGWIVSGVALASQLLLVPPLLPYKRVALLMPPVVMLIATLGLAFVPTVALAIVTAASDRGLNYSLQQVTKETLYVPLTDAQRYKAKALIDMFVDRAAKALSSIGLLAVIATMGVSIGASLALAVVALGVWAIAANALGKAYKAHVRQEHAGEAPGRAEAKAPESVVEHGSTPDPVH
jgi:ATP:ADP antiporter, AAA family